MNIKSNILLPDSMNRLHSNIVINTDLVKPMFHISNSNHSSVSDGISIGIKPNSKSREHLQPFTPATTTASFMMSTSLPRTRPSIATTLQTTHKSDSQSPVSVSLVRSNSEPNRTNNILSSDSNIKSSDMGLSNFNFVSNNFSRQSSVPVSNASVIAFTSAERIMSKSSKELGPMGKGLTMSGLSIHRISKSIPPVNASYQSTQVNGDVNINTNALESVCAITKNIEDSGHLLQNKICKNYEKFKGSLDNDIIINSNDYEYITNRKSIKREEKIYCDYISSSTNNGESHNNYTNCVSWDNGSGSSHPKPNPVISIIPMVPTISVTTNGNKVSNIGNEVRLYESCISHKEEPRETHQIKSLQLTPNSVTITQLQPTLIHKARPIPQQPKLIYRALSYDGDSAQPGLIAVPMERLRSGNDSSLEHKTNGINPVTITPVSYSQPVDTLMEDPHPLNLFSTVAANQEYLPTNTTATTHNALHERSTQANTMNADMCTLSEHENYINFGQFVRTASNEEFSFSEYMDHSDSLSLSPPPAGMQRRPKVSYKNLSEGEKNVRLRMLNNEASRLYRHRKQHTIKNLEVEEKQLRTVNTKLRVEFEALQSKRDEAMKMLHESLKRCRECNPSQSGQSGPCPHRNINTSSNSFKIDTHTTKLIIKDQVWSKNM